jgi:protein PhnA
MELKRTTELHTFLSTYFPDADPETDEQITSNFLLSCSSERQQRIIDQIKRHLESSELPLEEIGTEVNRWFGESEEAHTWLRKLLGVFESAQAGGSSVVVKDSNGTPLSEGDSVLVIKDLKVKGGSSDLKRGTLVKKIHLIDDPEIIECRVDGSTLVLKTCFLKKA